MSGHCGAVMLLTKWWQGLSFLLPAQLTPFSPSCKCQFRELKALVLVLLQEGSAFGFFFKDLSSLISALQVWHVGFGLSVAKSAGPSPSIILKPKKLQIQAAFSVPR